MNTDQQPDAGASREPLPELSDERINRIETSLFSEIARDRTAHRKRRTGVWVATSAAAAVIVVAAVIAPSVGGLLTGTASNDAAVGPAAPLVDSGDGGESDSSGGVAPDPNAVKEEGLVAPDDAGAADSVTGADVGEPTRDIITTASATIVVGDISAAAAMITDAAVSRDGYVESMSIGQSGQIVPVDPETGMVYDSTMPYPYTPDGAWITVRVPADGLQSLVDQLSGLGEVTASAVNRQDVTAVTLDLEARVEAAQASVDRLTELMAQAGNLSDLIAAESALAERQATLESYQQQLKYYDEQVAMSTLTVTLTEPVETGRGRPHRFRRWARGRVERLGRDAQRHRDRDRVPAPVAPGDRGHRRHRLGHRHPGAASQDPSGVGQQRRQLGERLGHEPVVRPGAPLGAGEEAGVHQHLEVVGYRRLTQPDRVREVADARFCPSEAPTIEISRKRAGSASALSLRARPSAAAAPSGSRTSGAQHVAASSRTVTSVSSRVFMHRS